MAMLFCVDSNAEKDGHDERSQRALHEQLVQTLNKLKIHYSDLPENISIEFGDRTNATLFDYPDKKKLVEILKSLAKNTNK